MVLFLVKNYIYSNFPLREKGGLINGGLHSCWHFTLIPDQALPFKGRKMWSVIRNAVVHNLFILVCIYSYCIVGQAFAESIKNPPKIVVDTEYNEGGLPFISRTISEGRELLPGNFHIRANVQLPLNDEIYILKSQPIKLLSGSANGLTTLSTPKFDTQSNILNQTQFLDRKDFSSNILKTDELWLTYRVPRGSNQCSLSVDIEVEGVPHNKESQITQPSAKKLKLFSRNQQLKRIEIPLDGVKVLPRDISYLIKSRSGVSPDNNWRLIEEKNRHVFMRLLRVDLHHIHSIELAINDTIQQVNFRLSRLNTGQPTDILTWETIPKDMFVRGGVPWVRLDLAKVISQQRSGALDANAALTLVEIIAFVQKDAESNTVPEAPIRALRVNYSEPVSGVGGDHIELHTQIERAGPDKWLWRSSMAAMNAAKLDQIKFLRGQITEHKKGCIAAVEKAEFVRLATRKVPVALTNIKDSAQWLGGPFGLTREDDELELPKLLAHLPLDKLSIASLTLPAGGRQVWGDMGLTVAAHGTSPLVLTLNAGRLLMKGSGDILLSWASRVTVPAHAYLSVHQNFNNDPLLKTRVRLRFSDGHAEMLPYSLGAAISLSKFAGRTLVGADVFLRLPTKGGEVSIEEMSLFQVKVVKTAEALKETLTADRMLDAYKVKLGNIEFAPKPPATSFWQDLAEGQAWLDYGDVTWGGGAIVPVLSSLNPMLGMVKEWRFVYRGGADASFKAWQVESHTTNPASDNPYKRWLKFSMYSLLLYWALALWERGRLLQIAVLVLSRLAQLSHRASSLARTFTHSLWSSSVAQRKVLNFLVVMLPWGGVFLYYALCPLGPFDDNILIMLILSTLFSGLNIWRWHIEGKISNTDNFLQRRIVTKSVWPSRIIWVIALITVVIVLLGIVNQLFVNAGIEDSALILSEDRLVSNLALLGISILTDSKSLMGWLPMLLAVLCGLLPWLCAWVYQLTMASARWLVLGFGLGLYALGLTHIGQPGENYYFTFGGMVMVVIWSVWMKSVREHLLRRWPTTAEKIYGGAGSIYLSGALVGVAIIALLIILRLELLAEQMAVVVYFCLVVGVVLEIMALRRAHNNHSGSLEPTPTPLLGNK